MFSQRLSLPPSAFPPFQGKPWGQALPCSHGGAGAGWEGIVPGVCRAGWGWQGCQAACSCPQDHPGTQIHSITHPQGMGPARLWGAGEAQPSSLPRSPPQQLRSAGRKTPAHVYEGNPTQTRGQKGPQRRDRRW